MADASIPSASDGPRRRGGKTLTDLPAELLIHICQLLYLASIPASAFHTLDPLLPPVGSSSSSHDTGDASSSDAARNSTATAKASTLASSPAQSQAALYALCLTSRVLYDAARPLLFRRVRVTLPFSFLLLLRTLGASHLASAYEHFTLTGAVNVDPDDPASFANMVAAAGFAHATGGTLVVGIPSASSGGGGAERARSKSRGRARSGSRSGNANGNGKGKTSSPYAERERERETETDRSRSRNRTAAEMVMERSLSRSRAQGLQVPGTSSGPAAEGLSGSTAPSISVQEPGTSTSSMSAALPPKFQGKLLTDADGEVELVWQEAELLSETATSDLSGSEDWNDDTDDTEMEDDYDDPAGGRVPPGARGLNFGSRYADGSVGPRRRQVQRFLVTLSLSEDRDLSASESSSIVAYPPPLPLLPHARTDSALRLPSRKSTSGSVSSTSPPSARRACAAPSGRASWSASSRRRACWRSSPRAPQGSSPSGRARRWTAR